MAIKVWMLKFRMRLQRMKRVPCGMNQEGDFFIVLCKTGMHMRVNEYQYRTIDALVISSTRDIEFYDDDNAQWMEASTAPLELNPKYALLLLNTLDRGSGIFKNILKS